MEFWQGQPQIRKRLERVRALMAEQIPDGGRFSSIISDLVENQGKMLRPALLLLSAGFEHRQEEALHLAAALEYLHMASLVHDDIIDEAKERRGKLSVVRAHGMAMALYTGDYLIYLSGKCLLKLDPPLLAAAAPDFMGHLLEAEAEQLESRYRIDLSEAQYLERIEAKTGLLFALAASLGYALNHQDQEEILEMKQAGLDFGAAFQLRDDLEDLLDPAHGDLREGNYTYPVLAAAAEDEALSGILSHLKQNKGHDAAYDAVVRRVTAGRASDKTKAAIGVYLKRAQAVFHRRLDREEDAVCQAMILRLFGGGYDH